MKNTYLYDFNRRSIGNPTYLILAYNPIVNRQFDDLIKGKLRELWFGYDVHSYVSLRGLLITIQPSINLKILECYALLILIIGVADNVVPIIIHDNVFNYYAVTIPIYDFQRTNLGSSIPFNNEIRFGFPNNEICLTFLFGYLFTQLPDGQPRGEKSSYCSHPTAQCAKPVAEANCFDPTAPIYSDKAKIQQPHGNKHPHASRCYACNKATIFAWNHFKTSLDYYPLNSTAGSHLERAAA